MGRAGSGTLRRRCTDAAMKARLKTFDGPVGFNLLGLYRYSPIGASDEEANIGLSRSEGECRSMPLWYRGDPSNLLLIYWGGGYCRRPSCAAYRVCL